MSHIITTMEDGHLEDAVQIHLKAFPGFFLSFLGPRFLKTFYRSFIEDDMGICLVAQDCSDGKILGIVVGPLVPDGYYKRLVQRKWLAFCMSSLTAIIRKPSKIPRLYRAVFYRGEAPVEGDALALLASIAVSPKVGTKGVGRDLLRAFVEEVKRREGKGVFLTTDADDNDRVNRFYETFGFSLESSFSTHEGRRMNRYVLRFTAN